MRLLFIESMFQILHLFLQVLDLALLQHALLDERCEPVLVVRLATN